MFLSGPALVLKAWTAKSLAAGFLAACRPGRDFGGLDWRRPGLASCRQAGPSSLWTLKFLSYQKYGPPCSRHFPWDNRVYNRAYNRAHNRVCLGAYCQASLGAYNGVNLSILRSVESNKLGSVQSSVQSMVLATVQSSEHGSILESVVGSVVGA